MLTSHRPAPPLAALLLLGLLLPCAARAQDSRNVYLLAHLNDYDKLGQYSACWSYVHSDGREYAILGHQVGTSIVNVTDPAASYEVAFIPGLTSIWREMKQYRDYVYISTEADGGGIQIVKMTDPQNPVLVNTYATNFNRAHTLEVDSARALLYCNGTRLSTTSTGMRILSLADPEHPVQVGVYGADYVHDCFPSGTRLYASCIASKTMRVLDVSNPAAPFEIASWTYPRAATHSAEPSRDGRHLYICDEVASGTMKVFDITNLAAPVQVNEAVVNPQGIAHNIHVRGDIGYMAYYTEGVRLFDLADPAYPAEFGHFDTYPGPSGGFNGVWEVAPFFPSGTFIASDIQTGLYVFRMDPYYGTVKVHVTDSSGAPVFGADVREPASGDSTRTAATGDARLALDPGPHTLRVHMFGYEAAFVPVMTTLGGQDSIAVTLYASASAPLFGSVRRSGDLAPITDATLTLLGTPLSATSAADGAYSIPSVPVGSHVGLCERSGYAPFQRVVTIDPGPGHALDWSLLAAAWYDSCDADLGWSLSAPGDDATDGLWLRAEPVGTSSGASPAPRLPDLTAGGAVRGPLAAAQHPEPEEGGGGFGPVQPGEDHTPGLGGACFVTGNGAPGGDIADADVDGGRTTLTTPPLDLTGIADPTIGFQRWYYSNASGEPDPFLVELSSDGANWVTARTITESHPEWHHELIRVADYVTPGSAIRVRFVAQDAGAPSVVEAGVDDLELHDATLLPASVPAPPASPAAAALDVPRPNPTAATAFVTLRLRSAGTARVQVFDAAGRRIATLFDGEAPAGPLTLAWGGKASDGAEAPSGVYWIRAEAAGERFVRKQVVLR